MKISFFNDILLNIVLPVALGCLLYRALPPNTVIRNYLPDGLWAYSLFYALLVIWNRKIHLFWALMVFLVFVLFELFQYLHFINGTGDILDVLTYCLFSGLAFFTNKYLFFIKTNQLQND